MKEITLDQGSAEWLAWRKGVAYVDDLGVKQAGLIGPRITATAASVCGGHSPFSTPDQLYSEMLGIRKRQVPTFVMDRGTRMEPIARAAYMKLVGEDYEAICIESSTTPWIAASLDGVDLLRTRGVEIKCPMSDSPTGSHALALNGVVAPYYYDQIQWQMLSSDNQIKEIDYFSFAPKMGPAPIITVEIDLVRQQQLVDEVVKFRLAMLCPSKFRERHAPTSRFHLEPV